MLYKNEVHTFSAMADILYFWKQNPSSNWNNDWRIISANPFDSFSVLWLARKSGMKGIPSICRLYLRYIRLSFCMTLTKLLEKNGHVFYKDLFGKAAWNEMWTTCKVLTIILEGPLLSCLQNFTAGIIKCT